MERPAVAPERPKRAGGWLRKIAKLQDEVSFWKQEAAFWHGWALKYRSELRALKGVKQG